MIVIMGATGNTGRPAAEALLAAGKRVRVVGRDAARLAGLVAKGAEAAVGDAEDKAFVARAFAGAESAYTLLPPDYSGASFFDRTDRLSDAVVHGVRESGLKRLVLLASLGAQHEAGTGPIRALHRAEKKLSALAGLNVLFLRPGYFFENFFGALGLIRHQGVNGGVIQPDVKVSMIATKDIAAALAKALLAADWQGVAVRELHGPELTMREATTILGAAIGKPDLAYVQFPDDGMRQGLLAAGIPAEMADLYVEMSHAINAGLVKPEAPRSPATAAPTRFEDFAPVLAEAYRAQG